MVIARGGRSLTPDERKQLLRQALANAPLPLDAINDSGAAGGGAAAQLRSQLRAALVRVEHEKYESP